MVARLKTTPYELPPESVLRQNYKEYGYVRFFENVLKTELRNGRNSWGAQNQYARVIFSNLWADRPSLTEGGRHYLWFRSPDDRYNGRKLPGGTERAEFMAQLQGNPELKHYGVAVIDPNWREGAKASVWGIDTETLLELANTPILRDGQYAIEVVGTKPVQAVVSEMEARRISLVASQQRRIFLEGASQPVNQEEREIRRRSQRAIRACIEHYTNRDGRLICQTCGWSRPDGYSGRIIEIHHKTPFANRAGEYAIDPVEHLIPLCPTCHRMAHDSSQRLEFA
jgi:hypothetical protein